MRKSFVIVCVLAVLGGCASKPPEVKASCFGSGGWKPMVSGLVLSSKSFGTSPDCNFTPVGRE